MRNVKDIEGELGSFLYNVVSCFNEFVNKKLEKYDMGFRNELYIVWKRVGSCDLRKDFGIINGNLKCKLD